MKPFQLTTIKFSHYNEKARWGLAHFKIPYKEFGYMPMAHFAAAAWASRLKGKSDGQSTRFSTPVMRTDMGEVICDSSDILHYLSKRFGDDKTTLFPNDEAVKQEKLWSETLAARSRSFAYAASLGDPDLIGFIAEKNVGPIQAALFKTFSKQFAAAIMKGLRIRENTEEWARKQIVEEWKRAESLLQDGRSFLAGTQFSAADIAFSCAAAPLLLVSHEEGYGATLPPLSMVSQNARAMAEDLRATPAGKFVLRMFSEFRG